ncbi:MAG: FGGY-family carbohydrate kinase [Oscillospiraceae bacterium]
MNITEQILQGKTTLGIELGSTRIKAVLIGENFAPIAAGTHDWENRFENGVWTYPLGAVREGIAQCFAALKSDVRARYEVELKTTASIGVSAMMHGYLAFDADDRLLVPFRTWRNTTTAQASAALTEAFAFHIPQRWSAAHLYQAILNREAHVPEIRFLTTLAGYVHWILTGEKVLGVGDASGMFPIDGQTGTYNAQMLDQFERLTAGESYPWHLADILPRIVPAGTCAGTLTEAGTRLLDPSGAFAAGIPFCPPEGDAQTGMVATNSIAPRTGNVSAGTSIFAMAVLERPLNAAHDEIDIVTTPCASPVAMVHCNNCSTDLDAWVKMLSGFLEITGAPLDKPALYDKIYEAALCGDADCGGLVTCNYHSGEHITGLPSGMPLLLRTPDAAFSVQNLMRSLIYSAMATLKIGMDILLIEEKIALDLLFAHGGLFKSPVTAQRFLAGALGVSVAVTESAGEGGAWGIALLAAYLTRETRTETLAEFLQSRVFACRAETVRTPDANDAAGFAAYMERFGVALAAERCAVEAKTNCDGE